MLTFIDIDNLKHYIDHYWADTESRIFVDVNSLEHNIPMIKRDADRKRAFMNAFTIAPKIGTPIIEKYICETLKKFWIIFFVYIQPEVINDIGLDISYARYFNAITGKLFFVSEPIENQGAESLSRRICAKTKSPKCNRYQFKNMTMCSSQLLLDHHRLFHTRIHHPYHKH